MSITYRKTKQGVWVAYGPAAEITAGATVEVRTKAGRTKFEVVESLGRPFTVNGVSMVYGYLEAPEQRDPAERAYAAPDVEHSVSPPVRHGNACSECGRNGARYPAVDSSGIAGVCCASCAMMQPYERSFA